MSAKSFGATTGLAFARTCTFLEALGRIVLFEFVWKKPFVSDQTSKSKLTAKKFDKTKQDEDPATKYEKRVSAAESARIYTKDRIT